MQHGKTIRENVINSTIWTDEETEIPVEIRYEYWARLMADTLVDYVYVEVKGKTVTPDFAIREQIPAIIQEIHTDPIHIQSKINLTFL